jgi:endonuclease/exonuclease/phosphatase family metal-dependent hydrolase
MQHRKTKIIRKPLHLLKAMTLKAFRYFMTFLIATVAVIFIVAGALLAFLMLTEYRPKSIESIPIPPRHLTTSPPHHLISCLTWNIGYAGLGREMDFFYDGGKRVRPEKDGSERYMAGISTTLAGFGSADFIFLQEVDLGAKRSYWVNQADRLSKEMPSHFPAVAVNYDCRFVPVPFYEPMGRVKSGLASFVKWNVASAERHSYDATFPWPKRLVFLKRCFLAERIPLGSGKELVMVNLHNSAFDASGRLRKAEMAQLKKFLEEEYGKGNYVVAGGDWNINPPGYIADSIRTADYGYNIPLKVPSDLLRGWQFAFDPSVPSNRDVDKPYVKGETGTTLIDFFVVSPNIKVQAVKTLNLGFEFSDHNPVLLTFELL